MHVCRDGGGVYRITWGTQNNVREGLVTCVQSLGWEDGRVRARAGKGDHAKPEASDTRKIYTSEQALHYVENGSIGK